MTSSTCRECGNPFTPARADARFCSSACRQRAYRNRKQPNTIRNSNRVTDAEMSPREAVERDAASITADMRALAARLRQLFADDHALPRGYGVLDDYDEGTPLDQLETAWYDLEHAWRYPWEACGKADLERA